MFFYEIYLRKISKIFTWHSEKKIKIGVRVRVVFRGKKTVGLVVRETEKSTIKTGEILQKLSRWSAPEKNIKTAFWLAEKCHNMVEKNLGFLMPDIYFFQENPVTYDYRYELRKIPEKIRGSEQKRAIKLLKKNHGKIDGNVFKKTIAAGTIKRLLELKIIKKSAEKITIPQYRGTIERTKNHTLNEAQKKVLDGVLKSKKPSLLFGVTGSGKTEIYKALAQKITEEGGQILFLLPEIALTPQLVAEFKNIFDDQIALWHSQMTEREKIQEWARIQNQDAKILIGTRSAVLIPLPKLRCIILDEEHEWTYKNEFSPRFWTHDIAEKLSETYKTKLLFGSATPRVESFLKVERGEWSRFDLLEKIGNQKPPKIDLVDMRQEVIRGNFSPISEKLIEAMRKTLRQKRQAVFFLNRRGIAGSAMCQQCGFVFESPTCSLPMKLHERNGKQKLICHYTGHMENLPNACPSCQHKNFLFRGWGTQAVEKELMKIFPKIRILRADADTVSGRYDFSRIIRDFSAEKYDVLLGTQMISKGLDFEKVDLCGVVLADVGLNLPDFRAEERVFQILMQVVGRAGRREKAAEIVVQTFRPQEKIFDFLRQQDTEAFIKNQQSLREKADMPPFSEVVKFTFSDAKKELAWLQSRNFFEALDEEISRVGEWHWSPAFFPKMYNKYYFHVFFQGKNPRDLFEKIDKKNEIKKLANFAKIDINPTTLL